MIRKLTIIFLLFHHALPAQNPFTDSLIAFYKKKVEQYLDKDKSLSGYYSVERSGIKIFPSLEKKLKDSAEFVLPWDDLQNFKVALRFDTNAYKSVYCHNIYTRDHGKRTTVPKVRIGNIPIDRIYTDTAAYSLKGKRIAIDPGHVGGSEEDARMERKMVKPELDSIQQTTDDTILIEGNLTMQTALLLKKRLEEKGAIVMLTRTREGQNAFGYSFETWMKRDLKKAVDEALRHHEISEAEKKKLLDPKTKREYIFQHFFVQEDLKKRAEKINAFRPDLTIVIHYNADEKNKHWIKTGTKDFNMAFIPGSFMEKEMDTRRNRFEFLRLLVSDDIDESKRAASSLINAFVKKLKVPAAKDSDATYLSESCINTGVNGVYCRNLALTRFVHGPVVYGETLYQDNLLEFKMLSNQEMKLNGVQTSIRVQQVADAYFDGISSFFSTR